MKTQSNRDLSLALSQSANDPIRTKPSWQSRVTKFLVSSLAASAVGFAAYAYAETGAQAASKFTLSSPDLSSGTFATKFTLNGFGCTGSNISPAIQWSNAPAGTKSFALQVQDEANHFYHWAVYNIPASATGLEQGAGNAAAKLPAPALGGTTDFLDTGVTGGNGNYAGPCPPVGDKPHNYQFTIYALAVDDVEAASGIPKTGTATLHSFIINKGLGSKLLGTASFTASYGH